MAAQQPTPFFQALRSHGTHFFLFAMICADLLAAVLSFVYGAWVGSEILAFLYWMLTWIDALLHNDVLSTVMIIIILISLLYGLIRRLWTREWYSALVHMLTIILPTLLIWLLLEILGKTFGAPTPLVQWIPTLPRQAFPTPIPLRLWPLWQYTGLIWAGGYLFITHRTGRYPQPDVNIKTKRIPIPMDAQELPAPPLPDPRLYEPDSDLFGPPTRGMIVDAPPAPQPTPREPGYRIETQIFPLALIHTHSEKWKTLESHYHGYRDALTRFLTPPLRKLSIPPQAFYYESTGHIGWQRHELVFPERLFHPKNKGLLPAYLAHELAYTQHLDLWLRDLLAHYPNDTYEIGGGILVGNFAVIPAAIKAWYMPRWEYDRTKDGDVFAYLLGQGPQLKRHFQRLVEKEKPMPSSATYNTESPTLSERIGQLEGLINYEYEQMRSYGLEPPAELPLWPDEPPPVQVQKSKKGGRPS